MKIPKERILEIYKNEYCSGESMYKLGEKYNISPAYFSRWFRKLGLASRSNKENSRRYELNHDYFENIDDEIKAYWLGFIYADGYVTKDNCVGIALKSGDYSHLEKFSKCVESNYPIKTYESTRGYGKGFLYSRIVMKSEKMKDDLEKHGVVENKTNVLKPPKLPEDLEKHFIRGYFDGDGSVWKQKSKKYGTITYSVSFVGTEDVLLFIMKHLLKNNIINREYKLNKRKEGQIVSDFKFGGNIKSYTFLNYLYEDSKVYLDRKYEKYTELKKLYNSRL